jgi:purine-binding chemotaxis protein CheW
MANDEARQPPAVPDAILEAIERAREGASEPQARERVPYLGFLLGTEIYGLPLQRLKEVSRLTGLRRIPGAPPGVAGLVNLRGEIVCALDARAILGLSERNREMDRRASDGAGFLLALRGFGDPLGLLVDSIADIFAIDPDEIEPPPSTWPAGRAVYFLGTTRVADGLMGLLDLDRLVKV